MPSYEFENLKTQEIQDFYFSLDNYPKLGEIREIEGQQWKRIMSIAPYGSVDGKSTDPFNQQKFIEKTANSKGSVGDVMDRAKEMSEARKAKLGYDPVQNKYFDDWTKKRSGKTHPADTRKHVDTY